MSEPSVTVAPTHPSAKALLLSLRQEYNVLGEYLPLAIGIDKQLLALRPELNRKQMRSALGMHTQSVSYLKTLQNAQQRFNLDGTAADAVSDEQRALATKSLREHFKKRAEQHKAQQAEEAAKREREEKLNKLMDKFSRN